MTNNDKGVAGTAFNAGLASLALIDDSTTSIGITDAQMAEALGYNNDVIQIKSNSWGPADDSTLGPIGELSRDSLKNSAETGRGGLGTIYVWAGGNGGYAGDNSNYDELANSIYTIAVAAITNQGTQAGYSEPGANLLVSAPGGDYGFSGITEDALITTTDIEGAAGYNLVSDYTSTFTGTSAACPHVAGVAALILEANPNLSWRDVQDILVKTAKVINPDGSGWTVNGAGYHFNENFGAGLVDAGAATALAAATTPLGPQLVGNFIFPGVPVVVPDANPQGVSLDTVVSSGINQLEHVVLKFSSDIVFRGDLNITLTSPSGTVSHLAYVHPDGGDGYDQWPFMTVRCWGEDPNGVWKLHVSDTWGIFEGSVTGAELVLYGTGTGSGGNNNNNSDAVVPDGIGGPGGGTGAPEIQVNDPSGEVKTTLRTYPVKGIIKEGVEVSGVYWRATDSTEWKATNGATSWYILAPLKKGKNTVEIQAISVSGVLSTIEKVEIKRKD